MQLDDYDHEEHAKYLREWLLFYGRDLKVLEELPEIGTLVSGEKEGPIVAAFLRQVEGNYVMLDGLIANPKIRGRSRSHAIDLAVEGVLRRAKKRKFKYVIATTKDALVIERSFRHGFQKLPHTVISLNLSGRDI